MLPFHLRVGKSIASSTNSLPPSHYSLSCQPPPPPRPPLLFLLASSPFLPLSSSPACPSPPMSSLSFSRTNTSIPCSPPPIRTTHTHVKRLQAVADIVISGAEHCCCCLWPAHSLIAGGNSLLFSYSIFKFPVFSVVMRGASLLHLSASGVLLKREVLIV